MYRSSELLHGDTKKMDFFFMGPRMEMDDFLNSVGHTRKTFSRYLESKLPYRNISLVSLVRVLNSQAWISRHLNRKQLAVSHKTLSEGYQFPLQGEAHYAPVGA